MNFSRTFDSNPIPGIDRIDAPRAVVGCDPGPEFCAFALVLRDGAVLRLAETRYIPVGDLIDSMVCGSVRNSWLNARRSFTSVKADAPFVFAFEKMSTRYGAVPGATTFDTCRNSGICQAHATLAGAKKVYGLSASDWRVAFGGSPHMKDSETRAEIINLFGEDADREIQRVSKAAKERHSLDKPVSGHMRDAVGVAAGVYFLPRRGVSIASRLVWRAVDA